MRFLAFCKKRSMGKYERKMGNERKDDGQRLSCSVRRSS
jgi:hypothetical protein